MSTPGPSEEDVNRRIEESVVGLPGVERVVATATEGLGRIDIELATFADAASVLTDVQNAVDGIENFPPLTADQPEVELQDLTLAVMTLAVSSATVGENELRLAAESPRSELLELPTISQVQLKGTRDREISIELSEEELRRHNLSLSALRSRRRSRPRNGSSKQDTPSTSSSADRPSTRSTSSWATPYRRD